MITEATMAAPVKSRSFAGTVVGLRAVAAALEADVEVEDGGAAGVAGVCDVTIPTK